MTTRCRPLAIVALASLLVACAPMPSSAESAALEGTTWVLSSLPRATLVAGPRATLRFADGRAAGSDGCNRYTTGFVQSGASLRFASPGASTRMACPPGATALAKAFDDALAATRASRVVDGRLELLGEGGEVLAAFSPQPEGLAGTSWRVTSYNNGRQAVTSTLAGTTLTMAFAADGRVGGSAGCNRYTGTFTQAGRALALAGVAATRRLCVEPERIMEQEQAFLKALETVAEARVEDDRLELRTADGALAVVLAQASGR